MKLKYTTYVKILVIIVIFDTDFLSWIAKLMWSECGLRAKSHPPLSLTADFLSTYLNQFYTQNGSFFLLSERQMYQLCPGVPSPLRARVKWIYPEIKYKIILIIDIFLVGIWPSNNQNTKNNSTMKYYIQFLPIIKKLPQMVFVSREYYGLYQEFPPKLPAFKQISDILTTCRAWLMTNTITSSKNYSRQYQQLRGISQRR